MKKYLAFILAAIFAANCWAGDLRHFGATSQLVRVRLTNGSTGNGLTSLTSASSGLIISTICDNESGATSYTAGGSTIETISTLGTYATPTATKCRFKEIDATNQPGVYEIQLADARFGVTNAKRLVISWTGATNLKDDSYEIQLAQFDPYSASNFITGLNGQSPPTNWTSMSIDGSGKVLLQTTQTGVTIPTVTSVGSVSGAVGSVTGSVGSISGVTFPTNFSVLSIDGNGRIDVSRILGIPQTGRDVGGAVPPVPFGSAGGIQRYKF